MSEEKKELNEDELKEAAGGFKISLQMEIDPEGAPNLRR